MSGRSEAVALSEFASDPWPLACPCPVGRVMGQVPLVLRVVDEGAFARRRRP